MLKFINDIVLWVGKIHWNAKSELSVQQKEQIRSLLKPHYYIILTHRSNHLSTFFVGLANFFLRGKWGYYAHSLMNIEDEVQSVDDFRLVEAIGTGVQYTPFDQVFDVQGVALLKPKNLSLSEWTAIMDRAKTELGKPYDTLFDLKNDTALSCVELVRTALMAESNYAENFKNFEKMISSAKNLTPQMFYDCPDFEVIFEARV